MTHKLIIEVLGKWWFMNVNTTIIHAKQMQAGPNVPRSMLYACSTVYDATNKKMIKNRTMGDTLNDAIVMRLWLNDELPEFKWNGYKRFRKDLSAYYESLEE